MEKLFNCHQGGLHVIEPFQLPLLWHNEPKIITVGQKKPPQCLTQSIKCTKCIKGLIYLVQHLSPKMLAHCRDSLVWLSLQCHLSNTKQIWVKFLSGNVLRVLSYVQTNIPKVSYFIIKIGILIYSKRIIIIQRRQPQRVLSINA